MEFLATSKPWCKRVQSAVYDNGHDRSIPNLKCLQGTKNNWFGNLVLIRINGDKLPTGRKPFSWSQSVSGLPDLDKVMKPTSEAMLVICFT